MYDKGKILIGIVIFLVLVLLPVWYAAARGGTAPPPDLVIGTDAKACVRDTVWMRESHMQLLDEWRDLVVREGQWIDQESQRPMSLTGTCLECHTDYAGFCEKCHTHAGVDVYCWDCHVIPGEDVR